MKEEPPKVGEPAWSCSRDLEGGKAERSGQRSVPKCPLFPGLLGNPYLHFPMVNRGKAAWVSSFGVLGAGWWPSILVMSGQGAVKQGRGAESVTACVLPARPAWRDFTMKIIFLPLSATAQRRGVSRGRR